MTRTPEEFKTHAFAHYFSQSCSIRGLTYVVFTGRWTHEQAERIEKTLGISWSKFTHELKYVADLADMKPNPKFDRLKIKKLAHQMGQEIAERYPVYNAWCPLSGKRD